MAKRIPDEGRLAIDVREMPVLDLTVIPFLWRSRPDSATLDLGSDQPMVILRNPLTRQVRGILPGGPEPVAAQRDAATAFGPGIEVLFSRGIPDTAEWRW